MAFAFPIGGRLRWTEDQTSLNLPTAPNQILTYCTQQWTITPTSGAHVELTLKAPFPCKLTLYGRGDERALAFWPTLEPLKLDTKPGALWVDTHDLKPVLIVGINSSDPEAIRVHNSVIEEVIQRRGVSLGNRLSAAEDEERLREVALGYHTGQTSAGEGLAFPNHDGLGGPQPPSAYIDRLALEVRDRVRARLDTLNLPGEIEFATLRNLPNPSTLFLGWAWYSSRDGSTWWTPFSQICEKMSWSGVPAAIARHARRQRGPWQFRGDRLRDDLLEVSVAWEREGQEVMRLVNPPMASEPIDLPGTPFTLNGAHSAIVTVTGPSGGGHHIHVSSPIVRNDQITYPNRTSATGSLTLPDLDGFWFGLERLAATRGRPRVTIQVAGERFRFQAAGRLAVLGQASDAVMEAHRALLRFLEGDSPSYRDYRGQDEDPVDRTVKRRDLVLMAQKIDALQAVCDQWQTLTEWETAQSLRGATGEVFAELKRLYRVRLRARREASRTLQALVTRDLWDEVVSVDTSEGYTTFLAALRALRLTDEGKAHLRSLLEGFLRDETAGFDPMVSRSAWAQQLNSSAAAREVLVAGLLDLSLADVEAIADLLHDGGTAGMEAVKRLVTELTNGLAQIGAFVGFPDTIQKAIQDAEAARLSRLVEDAEFAPPSANPGLTDPPVFADVFRCTIVLLNTAVAVAEFALDPTNSEKRDAMAGNLARLGTEAARVGSLIVGARDGATLTATAAEKLAHKVPIALGLVWSAYDLGVSAQDAYEEDEDDVFAWKLTGVAVGAAGLGLEVLALAGVGAAAGPVGVFVGFALGVVGVLASQMAERAKDPEVVKLVKLTFMGVARESDEVSEDDSDYRHMYRRFGAQLSHLNHFWHNLGARMGTYDDTTRIDLSNVPPRAMVVIQAWEGEADLHVRSLYWFEADNFKSHGSLRGHGGGAHDVVIAQSGPGIPHMLEGRGEAARFTSLNFDQSGDGDAGMHHRRRNDGMIHVYIANEDLDRAVVSVEMSPPTSGAIGMGRFLCRVGTRLHVHGFLSQMPLFASTLVKKGE